MKNYAFLILLFLVMVACNNSNEKGNNKWVQSEREEFLNECHEVLAEDLKQYKNKVDSTKVMGICPCVLEKVEKKYPDPNKIKPNYFSLAKSLMPCIKEALGK